MTQNKSKFNGRIRLLVVIGCSLLLLIVCGIASLFILEIEDVIYADGQISSELTIDMVSHLDGRITKLHVNAGQEVKKGDIIAEIDATPYEQEYMAIQSALQELEAMRRAARPQEDNVTAQQQRLEVQAEEKQEVQ